MRVIVLVAAIVLAAANLAAQNVKADHSLDVPGHIDTPITPLSFSPGPNGIFGAAHSTFPTTVRLTLLSVDRMDFVYGDHFIYEVLIENTGKEPLTLPWSPNRGEFMQPVPRIPDGFRSGSVSLHVESASGEPTLLSLLDGQSLYGSNEIPRSLLILAAGRTARIRVPAQWSAPMPQGRTAILQQPDGAVRLRAVFSVHNIGFPLTRSINTIPVRVMPFQFR